MSSVEYGTPRRVFSLQEARLGENSSSSTRRPTSSSKSWPSYHGGNRSLVVRHAIQVYSDMEDRLEEIETNPAFQATMAKSAADIKAGRVIPHEEVVRRSRAKTAKSKRR
jgi:predicted transcriptional regulator